MSSHITAWVAKAAAATAIAAMCVGAAAVPSLTMATAPVAATAALSNPLPPPHSGLNGNPWG